MILPIQKIDSVPVKDESGAIKRNPRTDEPIMEKKLLDEGIDVTLVKSVRPFHKNGKTYENLTSDDISVVYIKPSPNEKAVEMHVVGNWLKLIHKINSLRVGILDPIE